MKLHFLLRCTALTLALSLAACSTDNGSSGSTATDVGPDADFATRLAAFVPTQTNESALGNGWIAAGQPDEKRLKEVLALGATIITLRYKTEDPFDEDALIKTAGGTLIRYEVKSSDYEKEDFRNKLWDIYDKWEKDGGLVFLHCKSSNRVGASWALYQFYRKGKTAQEAYKLGEKAGMKSASDVVKKVLKL